MSLKRGILFSSFILLVSWNASVSLCWAADLAEIQSAFLKGEYATVLAQTRARLSSSPVSSEDELLYLQGVSAFKLQEPDLAKESLDRLSNQFPQSPRQVEAKIALAQVLSVLGDRAEAIRILEKLRLEEKAAPFEPQIREVLASLKEFSYSVQVGAFRTQENAMRLRKELERRGYDAFINKAESTGEVFYRVRVGHFQEKQDAEAQTKKIHSEGFPGHVVP